MIEIGQSLKIIIMSKLDQNLQRKENFINYIPDKKPHFHDWQKFINEAFAELSHVTIGIRDQIGAVIQSHLIFENGCERIRKDIFIFAY